MTHVTAWPTVEWLIRTRTHAAGNLDVRCAIDRPAIPSRSKPDLPARFLSEVRRRLPHVRSTVTSAWVATPLGEQCVDVCLRVGHRRVGIQFSGRYEMNTRQLDAICLVYGHLDVLFRVDPNAAPAQVEAALAALKADRPVPGVTRMRLCCASDWVPHFEQALGKRSAG